MGTHPTRTIAGVTVADTPLIRAALAFAREHSSDMTYNHVLRSWLYSVKLGAKGQAQDSDPEVMAVSTLLHDLAWDCTDHPTFVSSDKRFEVDSANAAREFLAREAPGWDKHKVQLVWDAIALHSTTSIALHKEQEVAVTHLGIGCDILGPGLTGGQLTQADVDDMTREVPRLQLKEGMKKLMCALCKEKPRTTYDNFVGDIGDAFLEGNTRMTFAGVMEALMAE